MSEDHTVYEGHVVNGGAQDLGPPIRDWVLFSVSREWGGPASRE